MKKISLKKEVQGTMDALVDKITPALQKVGFGILTRIDFHTKMKEKLNKDLSPVVILGACNPALAYEAYTQETDTAGLVPCNVVLRDLGHNRISIEITKPSVMLELLGLHELAKDALEADKALQSALEGL